MSSQATSIEERLEQFQTRCRVLQGQGREIYRELRHRGEDSHIWLNAFERHLESIHEFLRACEENQELLRRNNLKNKYDTLELKRVTSKTERDTVEIKRVGPKNLRAKYGQVQNSLQTHELLGEKLLGNCDPDTLGKRAYPRLKKKLRVRYASNNTVLEQRTCSVDIGPMGMFVLSRQAEEKEQVISLKIDLPGVGMLDFEGVVAWTQWVHPALRKFKDCGFGIKFTKVPAEWFEFLGIPAPKGISPLQFKGEVGLLDTDAHKVPHHSYAQALPQQEAQWPHQRNPVVAKERVAVTQPPLARGLSSGNPAPQTNNKRRMPRYLEAMKFICSDNNSQKTYAAISKDIGPRGIGLLSSNPESVGEQVVLKGLLPDNQIVLLHGTVVWCNTNQYQEPSGEWKHHLGVEVLNAPTEWFSYFLSKKAQKQRLVS